MIEYELRMFGEREFQRVGAEIEKALSPMVRCFNLCDGGQKVGVS